VNQQSIYNDKNWLSVYFYGLMSILAGDCKYVMNAVEIAHDFTLFLMIWPSHLETKPNPNQKKQPRSDILERIKPNRTELELIMPKICRTWTEPNHKREEPKPNQ